MWQQSRGCRPSLMSGELRLTNYPSGQPLVLVLMLQLQSVTQVILYLFSPLLPVTRTEP